jgi:hypothetical protein
MEERDGKILIKSEHGSSVFSTRESYEDLKAERDQALVALSGLAEIYKAQCEVYGSPTGGAYASAQRILKGE